MATIQGVYLALFGRPADPAGLAYFNGVTNNGANLAAIDNLSGQQEYLSRFTGMTNEQIVTSIYQSLFGRVPEQAGLDFFVGQLASGKLSINTIAINILDGAAGTDKAVIDAKLAAAELFTSHLDLPAEVAAYNSNTVALARAYLDTINASKLGIGADVDAVIQQMLVSGGQGPGGGGGGGGGGGDTGPTPVYDVNAGDDLQAAIDGAAVGATITVGPGTFNGRYVISHDVKIVGATGTVVTGGFDVRNGAVNVTISDLDVKTIGAGDNNAAIHVVDPLTSTLKDLTLSGVDVSGSGTKADHGLLLNENSNGPNGLQVTITDSSFTNLLSAIYAGVARGNQFKITNSDFTDNNVGIGGVGNGAGLTIKGSNFAGNTGDDIGVEPLAKLKTLILDGNIDLDKFNIYDTGGPFVFKADTISESNIVLVGLGGSIDNAIGAAGTTYAVLLGAGTHNENLTIDSKVFLKGVDGAILAGQSGAISTIILLDPADGSQISNLHIVAVDGGNALYNPLVDVRNITLDGNTFDGGTNTANAVVYLNPGADGWVISGNTFLGAALTGSPLLGIEGNGHHILNNVFGSVAGTYTKIESWTPSVIFEGNTGTGDISFGKYGAGGIGNDGSYTQKVVNVSDLTGHTEIALGAISIVDSPFDGRGNSLSFISGDETGGRLRYNEKFDTANEPVPMKLGEINVLQFDYLVDAASRTNTTPALRLWVDADGDMTTTGDRGELVFEWAYQGATPVARDVWDTVDIVGDNLVLWQRGNATNFDGSPNLKTLEEWKAGFTPATGLQFNADSVVYGFSVAFGTYNGTGVMFTDNVAIGTTGTAASDSVHVYNFQ